MEKTTQFSSKLLQSSENSQIPRLQLMRGGTPFGGPLDGALIEDQYQVDTNRFLLFITDDVPYEETLRVYLIADDAEVLDALEFGGYLANGSLEGLSVVDQRTVEFSFIHKKRCRLTVQPDSSWKKPLSLTPGVSRPGGLKKRYLDLEFV